MLELSQITKKYGQPGDERNFTTIALPYPMRVAWDIKHTVTTIRCHKLIATVLSNVFQKILEVYGYNKIIELGIDLYGGCYNFRKMRGGKQWSRHSWAIAIDLDPSRNGLRTQWSRCQFYKKEYKPMIEIFYRNGFVNQGIEKGFDGMHFEIGL